MKEGGSSATLPCLDREPHRSYGIFCQPSVPDPSVAHCSLKVARSRGVSTALGIYSASRFRNRIRYLLLIRWQLKAAKEAISVAVVQTREKLVKLLGVDI